MDADLDRLRNEVRSLQKEEQSRLEEDKQKALDRLKQQVNRVSSPFCDIFSI